MIAPKRYTSGRIAVANLSATIEGFETAWAQGAGFEDLLALSRLLFLRGDLLGRIADHERAERVATEAAAAAPTAGDALFVRAHLAERFHRFAEATSLLDAACAAGHPQKEVDTERAALLQATGRYAEARLLRERQALAAPGIPTLGALAILLAEMGERPAAEIRFAEALEADGGVSPLPCGQLLFAWGVAAMRAGNLDRAESIFLDLEALLPAHVPGRGHRAEVALARGELDLAAALLTPLLAVADDPEYRAIHAEILAASGNAEAAASEAEGAAGEYERLLARRPEAYADHAAAFFMGVGRRPQRALELASFNWQLRDTPRSRRLLSQALAAAGEPMAEPCALRAGE